MNFGDYDLHPGLGVAESPGPLENHQLAKQVVQGQTAPPSVAQRLHSNCQQNNQWVCPKMEYAAVCSKIIKLMQNGNVCGENHDKPLDLWAPHFCPIPNMFIKRCQSKSHELQPLEVSK